LIRILLFYRDGKSFFASAVLNKQAAQLASHECP